MNLVRVFAFVEKGKTTTDVPLRQGDEYDTLLPIFRMKICNRQRMFRVSIHANCKCHTTRKIFWGRAHFCRAELPDRGTRSDRAGRSKWSRQINAAQYPGGA